MTFPREDDQDKSPFDQQIDESYEARKSMKKVKGFAILNEMNLGTG